MTTFTIHTHDSAPAKSKEHLEAAKQRFGQVPNLYGVLAEAPIAVEAYDTLANLLMRSSFTPTERHVVWFTINAYHSCHYCMASHTLGNAQKGHTRQVRNSGCPSPSKRPCRAALASGPVPAARTSNGILTSN